MLNQLLEVSIGTLIMEIFIILGVVVAGSLICYFIWEGISILAKRNENKVSEDIVVVEPKAVSNATVEDFKLEDETVNLIDENKVSDIDEAKAEEEKEELEEDAELKEKREFLEQRRMELIRRMKEAEEEEKKESEDEMIAIEEEPEEELFEFEEEEKEEVTEAGTQDMTNDEELQALQAEKDALMAQKERYEQMCKELEEAKLRLVESVKEQIPVEPIIIVKPKIEDLKERLSELEEKIKVSDKEFKSCKKDYLPLNKVWRTHENDEKKLRRKEALVAKQKVMLYGVNNYADIDEEKAQKLAEDLDLLDGLKLSVQHCEEVMAKNQERYPLLQKMYEVLKKQNDEYKAEANYIREEIERLENEENEGSKVETELVEPSTETEIIADDAVITETPVVSTEELINDEAKENNDTNSETETNGDEQINVVPSEDQE